MNVVTTEFLQENKLISSLDIHFTKFIGSLFSANNPSVSLATSLISNHTGKGHICLDLALLEKTRHFDENGDAWKYPNLSEPLAQLGNNNAIGKPGEYKPIIFDGNKLYLYRYWEYEDHLIRQIQKRMLQASNILDENKLKEGIERLFQKGNEIDWQKIAACSALINSFAVISGGPGTGKTTTVVKILALFLEQNVKSKILLAAPTGKAAARLQDSILATKEKINCSEAIKKQIPDTVQTIHRLLKKIPNSPYFFHNDKNRLEVDILVIDEASMIDLPLMSKLFSSLPDTCRIILIGDKNQLASVEVGAVFGDICGGEKTFCYSQAFCDKIHSLSGEEINTKGANNTKTIQDNIIQLQKNYRFGDESGIASVSKAVIEKNTKLALEQLTDIQYSDVHFTDAPALKSSNKTVVETILKGFKGLFQKNSIEETFRVFEAFRILTPLRKGLTGVEQLNRLVESVLRNKGLIQQETTWYHGRPILITRNDYSLNLFNGDTGIVLEDPESNALRVYFQNHDGSCRKFLPQRLPEHETAYCMTVHKSQGSEFESVLFLLPDVYTPILTHEVIYTGISRAKKYVEIWGSHVVFKAGVAASVERSSGLKEAFWG